MTDERQEKRNAYQRERYAFYRARGICTVCGKKDAVIAGLCGDCYAHKREADRAYRLRRREACNARSKAWIASKKAEGLCVSCGKHPAVEGHVYCEKCSARRKIRRRIRYAEERIARPADQCRWCENKAVPGYRYCPEHLERMRESVKRMNQSADNRQHRWREDNRIAIRSRRKREKGEAEKRE